MNYKPKVYFTSNVFSTKELGSNNLISENYRKIIENLWYKIDQIAEFKIFNGRFPSEEEIKTEVELFNPDILGCHLSHPISSETLKDSKILAISTSTAGYNHIQRTDEDDIIITHTPGILHGTVADYTIALIMASLRNLVDLNNYVWNEKWTPDDKWDLDQSLSSVIQDKILGIVGLGEIGKELVRKLYPWGVKILYHDHKQMKQFENDYSLLEYRENVKDIFKESDIISLHIPLNKSTEKLIDRELLKLMKAGSFLINTARGGIVELETLLDLLENEEIQINIAFDVFPIEPINSKTLLRLKNIKHEQTNLRIILMPHNASADANTRAKMNILFLEDIIKIIKSSSIEDLEKIHIIPEHKKIVKEKKWRIYNYWERK